MSDDGEETVELGSPVAPGDVLAEKYRIDRVLGAGGMGVVVAATHLELNDRVAVKFLLPHALVNEEATARFVREARAAVRIKSEHVARVIDVGRLENGAPYMVMEYLDGHDLSRKNSAGPLPIEEAIDYVLQACDAMAEAHAAGIIHRDLKPANLFRSERADGSAVVKVLDFGISKVADPSISDAGLTRTATAMGSPLYMSPEQLRSAKDVDVRADIWSLGAILFELLTSQTPFDGESFPELCAEILGKPPRSVRELRAEVPEALEQVVLRCLEKEPSARYQNVAELAMALGPFAPPHARTHVERTRRVLARAGMPSIPDIEDQSSEGSIPAPPADVQRTAAAWAETGAQEKPRSRVAVWVAIGGALLAVVVGAVMIGRSTVGSAAGEPPAVPSESVPVEPSTAATATVPQPEVEPDAAPSAVPIASADEPAAATTATAPKQAAPKTERPRDPKREEPKAKEPPAEKPKETAAPPPPPPPPPPPTTKKNPLDIGLK